MSVKTKRAVWLGSVVSVAVAGFATIASAADADKPLTGVPITDVQVAQAQPAAPASSTDEQKPSDKKVERVVVTGSRLKKNEFTSSSPIQVITSEESTLEGLADTADILQGSTIAAGSQQINNTFAGFVTNGGTGANTVGLRGLDPRRTLILVNGRRLAPAGSRGALGQPDLNTIPSALVDRYEILKDGGSAIYGSDAIAGVVNIITKKNYDGGVISAYGNMSEDGGGDVGEADMIYGDTFDRGQWMIGGEYYHREPLRVGDRDYLSCAQDNVKESGLGGGVSGVGVGGLLDIIDPATGNSKCFNLLEGVIDRVNTSTFPGGGRFIPDPTAVLNGGPFTLDLAGWRRVGLSYSQVANRLFGASATASASSVYAALTPAQRTAVEAAWRTSTAVVPNDDPRYLSTQIITPATRYSLFAQGSYDLFPGVEAYTELSFNRRDSEQERWRQLFPNVGATNPNNPLGVTSRSIVQVPTNSSQQIDFYRGVLGVRGDLTDKFPIFGGWSYDFYVQHQRSEGSYTNDIIYNDRVLATTQNATACLQAAITISGGNCADVPTGIRWFNPGVISDAAWSAAESAFLFTKETGHTTYSQTLVNGSVTGDILQLPAGALAGAIGFETRWDEIDDTPGFNARNNNLWGQTSAGRTAGSDGVREVYAEMNIPLLSGWKLAEDLNVDASWRYTSYDSYGEDTTYKLGMNWQITPEYRLRGTTGTSYRAPALFELFLANQTGFLAQTSIDPCIQWQTSSNPQIVASCGPGGLGLPSGYNGPYASALILTGGGGPGVLSAERSESRTVGFIWTPDWIDFSAAVDYWEIEVNNEVGQFGSLNIVTACHTQLPFGTSPFCTLFNRDTNPASPTFGMITQVNNSFVNISSEVDDGLDLTTRFVHEFSFGTFRMDTEVNWFFTRETKVFANAALTDYNGEVYFPDWVGTVDLRFDTGDWTFYWDIDMAARESNDEDFFGSTFFWRASPFAGSFKQYGEFYASHDASVRYKMEDWTLQVGVQNIFDDPPPTVSQAGSFGKIGNTIAVGNPVYDLVGRRGFVTITKEF